MKKLTSIFVLLVLFTAMSYALEVYEKDSSQDANHKAVKYNYDKYDYGQFVVYNQTNYDVVSIKDKYLDVLVHQNANYTSSIDIISSESKIKISHLITSKPDNLTYEFNYTGQIYWGGWTYYNNLLSINDTWSYDEDHFVSTTSENNWIMFDDGSVFDYSDLVGSSATFNRLEVYEDKVILVFDVAETGSYPYILDPSFGTGTIQNCQTNAYNYCNVSISSTISGTDFVLNNRGTTINAGVTVSVSRSRLTINSSEYFLSLSSNPFNAQGASASSPSGGSGGSGGSSMIDVSPPNGLNGANNGNSGTGGDFGCAVGVGGSGSGLAPFDFVSGGAGAVNIASRAAGGGGFYGTGAVYVRSAVCATALSGGSGHSIKIISANINLSGTTNTGGGNGQVGTGGAAGGSGAGELTLYGAYIRFNGTYSAVGSNGLVDGSCALCTAGGGGGGNFRSCSKQSYNSSGSTVTLSGGAGAGGGSAGAAGTSTLVSSGACFPDLIVNPYTTNNTGFIELSPVLQFNVGLFNSTANVSCWINNGVTTTPIGTYNFSTSVHTYSVETTYATIGSYNVTFICGNSSAGIANVTSQQITISVTATNVTASYNTSKYETEVVPISFLFNSTPDNITNYSLAIYYNNTFINSSNGSPAAPTFTYNTSFVNPLVTSNNTNKTIEVRLNITTNDGVSTSISNNLVYQFNETIRTWYLVSSQYPMSATYANTTELSNPVSVTLAARPTDATNDVTYPSFAYGLQKCTLTSGTGATSDVSCGNNITVTNVSLFTLLPTHRLQNGIIFSEYYVNRSYDLTYIAQPEAVSSKTITDAGTQIGREYFVWMVNRTNGTIAGSTANPNIHDVFNVTFYDEINFSQINIDTAVAQYTAIFPDGATKNFAISQSNTSNISSFLVRGYPNFSSASLNAFETYTKTGYVTRTRYLSNANTSLGTNQNITIYLLPNGFATYAVIQVVDRNGNGMGNVTVQITKFIPSNNSYQVIDTKQTASNGFATGYYQVDQFYKFYAYDSNNNLLYASAIPEQFYCGQTPCIFSIVVSNGSSAPLQFSEPYVVGNCLGNNSTNTITYSYSDLTGASHTMTFLAWRTTNGSLTVHTPVCNTNVTGSSGGYICTLSPPENLTNYAYLCEIRDNYNNVDRQVFGRIIDFRLIDGVTDWLLVAIVAIVGLAACGFNPVAGLAIVGIGLAGLSYLGYIPFTQAFVVNALVFAGVIIFLMGGDNG